MIIGQNGMRYTYDAENRLIVAAPDAPADGDFKIEMLYDYMGRRAQKVVSVYGSGAWVREKQILFVHDGWNVIKESTTTNRETSVYKYYVWGLDLSQSIRGAGGVGGLLSVVDGSTTYQYCYDGNSNVGQMVDASNGTIAAHYEYDPYGNEVKAIGEKANINPYRFSTKYFDAETEFYYYGYRFYSPELGRWVNRDPVGEEGGGVNLYVFVTNNSIDGIDLLGLMLLSEKRRQQRKWWHYQISGLKVRVAILNDKRERGTGIYIINGDPKPPIKPTAD